MLAASGLFKLLGDDARLRLLRLLARERLNVSELTAILGIAQSGVSRHLGLLRDAGLVREHRVGGFTYFDAVSGDSGVAPDVWSLLTTQFADRSEHLFRDDDARLREVLRLRREQRESHGAGTTNDSRQLIPGRSWAAWSRALGLLLSPVRVADLGCGDGYLTLEMAAWANDVVAVDRSEQVLAGARRRARRQQITNVVWKRGDIERLPLDDESVDVAILSQTLHHAKQPERALREATRILRRSGRVLVLDLERHGERWVKERLGDRWLGFTETELVQMMTASGLKHIAVRRWTDGDPFTVLMAAGMRDDA